MPSGPKRRKAAKKKKENTFNIDSPTSSQGNDDLRSLDEKESDGGEISSPASQDHQHHQLTQEEEEEKRDSSSVGSVVTVDHKPMEGSTNGEGEGTQKVEPKEEVDWVVRELKPEEDSKSKNFSIEYDESVKKSRDGGSSEDSRSSDGSSSDEESRLVDKNPPVMEQGKLEVQVFNSAMETAPVTPLVDSVVSMSEEATLVVEATPVEIPGASNVIELVSNETEVKMLPPSDENTGVSPGVLDFTLKENEDNMLPLSDETTGASSGVTDLVLKEFDDKLLQSDAPSVEISNGGGHSKKVEIPESSENQPMIASAPQTVQPTSWKSCCGLFDVLMGSNR